MAVQQDRQCGFDADQPRQTLRAAARGQKAGLDGGQGDGTIGAIVTVGNDPIVASEAQFERATAYRPMHRCGNRLAGRFECPQQLALCEEWRDRRAAVCNGGFDEFAEGIDVVIGRTVLVVPCHDGAHDGWVLANALDDPLHVCHERVA